MQDWRESLHLAFGHRGGLAPTVLLQRWWEGHGHGEPPALIHDISTSDDLCCVLNTMLSTSSADLGAWLELLQANSAELEHIAHHANLIRRLQHKRLLTALDRATRVCWRGYPTLIVNANETPAELARLLAARSQVAVVWYWHRCYHLWIASDDVDCRELAASIGSCSSLAGGARCATVQCSELCAAPKWSWSWPTAAAVALVCLFYASRFRATQ